MADEKSIVKMNKMIYKKTEASFLVVYVIYVSLVYTDSMKTASCLLPRHTIFATFGRQLKCLLVRIHSTADTCKNCAKCGKGFKLGTNEAYNIKIKIRLGGISKTFCFCPDANMASSDKGISLKKKFLKKFLLNVTN